MHNEFSKRLRTASASGSLNGSFENATGSTAPTSIGGSALYPPDDLFGGILHASPKSSRKGKGREYSDRCVEAARA